MNKEDKELEDNIRALVLGKINPKTCRDNILALIHSSNRRAVLAGQIAILEIAIKYGSKANKPNQPSLEEMIKRLRVELEASLKEGRNDD